jgi:2-dehydro-3-deoxyphosphooctonate aldolase (KDO 8-P synthase)
MREVRVGDSVVLGDGRSLVVVAGPCVVEGRQLCVDVAGRLTDACGALGLPYVFKSSFQKANRTSLASFSGPGLDEGLAVLDAVRCEVGVPVLTDIHLPEQAEPVSRVVDVVQVPAFLCRQTDLLTAAGRTGLPVNIKKGQFMAPGDMAAAAEKVLSTGNEGVILCERGTCFGYHDLVVDMRGIVIMRELGHPVLFDATHAVQRPSAATGVSGGDRAMAGPLAVAAVAIGCDGIFLETHPDPDSARSDSATMVPLGAMPELLERLKAASALAGRP